MIGRIPDQRAADDAAAEWLLRHEDGLSDSDTARFEAWLAESPLHTEAWLHAQAIWASFDAAPDPLLVSIQQSARAMRPPRRVLPAQGVAMAASILASIGLLAWSSGVIPDRAGPPAATSVVAAQHYAAGGKRTEVVLPDGSRVLLDAHSTIAVSQTRNRRDVALLDGQAFFRVQHDASRPFVVAANGRTVTATGTAFAVSVTADRMSVILEQGSVAVGAASGATVARLTPGQSYVAAGAGDGVVADVDVDGALAWRTGYVELHDVTIGEVVARMNRYSRTPVVVGDAQAGELRVTGQFRTDDPIRFVETLSELYPVRIKRGPGGTVAIVSVTRRSAR